jgi:hypothetical protein
MSKRKIFMVCMIGALMVFCSSTSFAAGTWKHCRILQIGGSLSVVNVQLGDATTGVPLGEANNGWYIISGDKAKEMLATVLTAVSLNKTVWAVLVVGAGASLEAIYMVAN